MIKIRTNSALAAAVLTAVAGLCCADTGIPGKMQSRDVSVMSEIRPMKRPVGKADRRNAARRLALSPRSDSPARASKRPSIYGAIVYAADWATDDDWNKAYYQMSTFRPMSDVRPVTVMEDEAFDISAGVYKNGKYYGVHFSEYETVYSVDFHTWDADTWQLERTVHSEQRGNIPVDLTLDETSGTVYGSFLATGNGYDFGTLDLTSGQKVRIAHFSENILAIAADREGTLYGVGWVQDGTTTLYRIDKQSGELTKVGDTGVKTHSFLHSATFDVRNDVLYWDPVIQDSEEALGVSALFTIDKTTGKAEEYGRFVNNEEVTGMFIITPLAEDGAPDMVQDLDLVYADGSLAGDVRFTMPSSTYVGGSLSGALSWTVLLDGAEVRNGTCAAGEDVSVPLEVSRGRHTVAVAVSNAVGRGPLASADRYFGYDTSTAPYDVRIEKVADNEVKVSWKGSEVSLNGGYLDPSRIVYNVVRMPGETVVASGIKETSVTDSFEEGKLTRYHYVVTPSVDGLDGPSADSESILMGSSVDIPYYEPFDTADSFELMTVVSGRRDVFKWSWYEKEQCARVMDGDGTPEQKRDDWLVLPPMRMSPDMFYTFTFRYRTYGFPEQFEVAIGQTPTREGLDRILVEPTGDLMDKEWKEMTVPVTVDSEGIYYLGIHSMVASRSGFYLFVDDLRVDGLPYGVPAAPVVSVEPFAKGAEGATVAVEVPSLTFDGKPLQGLTKVEVKRDGALVKTFDEGPTPGVTLTWEDTDVRTGMASYTACAYTAKGSGPEASAEVYVGKDLPDRVSDVKVTESSPGTVTVSWTAPLAGEHGGYIDPEALTYEVYRLDGNIEPVEEPVKGISGTSCEMKCKMTDPQENSMWAVYALNDVGYSFGEASDMMTIGEPLAAPFRESFAGGAFATLPWRLEMDASDGSECRWEVNANASVLSPQDMDGGLLTFVPGKLFDACTLVSPKVSVKGATSPTLEFWVYNNVNSPTEARVYIDADHGERQFIGIVESSSETVQDKTWTKVVIPLGDYVGNDFIQFYIKGISGAYNTPLFIDNIRIGGNYEKDLCVASITAPFRIMTGESRNVEVTVSNEGTANCGKSVVRLLDEAGGVYGEVDCPAIKKGASATVKIPVIPAVTWPEERSFHAEVVFAADQNPDNNVSAVVTIKTGYQAYPAVDDLSATVVDGGVNLHWTAPDPSDMEDAPVLFDVEDYEDFAIESSGMGEWTVVDVDGGEGTGGPVNPSTGGVFEYPNVGEPQAFIVFNPVAAGMAIRDAQGVPGPWAPHSGSRYFAAFFDIDQANDDWLISPRLSGNRQTVSFYVKAASQGYAEKYEFLYSKSDKDLKSFVKVAERTAPAAWEEVSFSVPQGARYFAVRCVSQDAFALLLDDFSFVPWYASASELEVTGYNIYRDLEPVNTGLVKELSFTDAAPHKGDNSYQVSVVYNHGESRLSNVVTVNPEEGSVAGITGDVVSVCPGEGMLEILGASGLRVTVVSADGAMRLAGEGEARMEISLEPGVYIVTVGDHPYRVLVR